MKTTSNFILICLMSMLFSCNMNREIDPDTDQFAGITQNEKSRINQNLKNIFLNVSVLMSDKNNEYSKEDYSRDINAITDYNNKNNSKYSRFFLEYISKIEKNTVNFSTPDDYKEYIENLKNESLSDCNLTKEEKKEISSRVYTIQTFIDYAIEFQSNTERIRTVPAIVAPILHLGRGRDDLGGGYDPPKNDSINNSNSNWWNNWGKCTAGVIGSVGTGALGGAGVGSLIPGLGTVTGAVVGGISAGLKGASDNCK